MAKEPTSHKGRALREYEASERLDISAATLATWRCRGKGPRYVRFGRAIRYFEADLDAYAESHAVDPEASE